jgi:hypothetical protein
VNSLSPSNFTQGENAPRKKPLMHGKRDIIGRAEGFATLEVKRKIGRPTGDEKDTRMIMIHME